MFYERFNAISTNLSRLIKTRSLFRDTAREYAELQGQYDDEDENECQLIALAAYGELECWLKLDDKEKVIHSAIRAARLFCKAANFSRMSYPSLKDCWFDLLIDGIHCYRVAIDTLKSIGKLNMSVSLLNELGTKEDSFDYYLYAGNAYEEGIRLSLEKNLPKSMVLSTVKRAIWSYTKADRTDLALQVLDKVLLSTGDESNQELGELKGLLLITTLKLDQSQEFFDKSENKEMYLKIIEQTKKVDISRLESMIANARIANTIEPLQLVIIEQHLKNITETVGAAYAEIEQ